MIKFFIPFSLTMSSIANSATPCYTDIQDGCIGSPIPIYVKTKDTDQGFCTEYTNEQKQKVVKCFKKAPKSQKKEDEQKEIANNTNKTEQVQPIIQQTFYNYQYQQTNNNNDTPNNYNNDDLGYWNGYWNGYNNSYYQGNRYPNRPPHRPHNRPPQKPPVITTPSRPSGKTNGSSKLSSARPAYSKDKPYYSPRPNKPSRGSLFNATPDRRR